MSFRGIDRKGTQLKRLSDGTLGGYSHVPAPNNMDGAGRSTTPKNLGDTIEFAFFTLPGFMRATTSPPRIATQSGVITEAWLWWSQGGDDVAELKILKNGSAVQTLSIPHGGDSIGQVFNIQLGDLTIETIRDQDYIQIQVTDPGSSGNTLFKGLAVRLKGVAYN